MKISLEFDTSAYYKPFGTGFAVYTNGVWRFACDTKEQAVSAVSVLDGMEWQDQRPLLELFDRHGHSHMVNTTTQSVPDPKPIVEAINAQMDAMLEATGGTSGRDFTDEERRAWGALCRARAELAHNHPRGSLT